MKFTILSHAGLAVEHAGSRLVCDPWLIGSCYWRSWWNFPEPPANLVENLAPHFIYLTHLHWDHFHGPSLKKLFAPDTTIIVPKVPTHRMLDDLRWLGFHHIVEVPHGGKVDLGPDFQLRSYQFGLGVDSAPVISGGGYTLFNCNDCKFFGLPLRQIMSDFPRIDFVFRSHSSASPVPHCIENHENLFPVTDSAADSADQFARCALYADARYAIPFASNHCFLHPETRHYNATATTPELAQLRYAALASQSGKKTECVVMPPGSSWSETTGFDIARFDFARRDEYVQDMLQRNAAALAQQAQIESTTVADFDAFKVYFDGFLRALPGFLKRRLPAVAFLVNDLHGTNHWCVDPTRGTVQRESNARHEIVSFEVHATVLNDCSRLKMFSVWTASKRLKIHLPAAAALREANLWFTLLDLYEVDLLPLRKNLTTRALAVRMRRWREPIEVANLLFRRVLLRQPFSIDRIYPLAILNSASVPIGGAAPPTAAPR